MAIMVKKQYLCGYYCQSCGAFNREVGELEISANVKGNVNRAVQRTFHKALNNVNQRKEYRLPGIKGVCQKCGTKQAWSGHVRKMSMLERALLLSMFIAVVAGLLGTFIIQSLLPLFLGCVLMLALLGVAMAVITRRNRAYWAAVCRQVDEQLAGFVKWNPYPYVAALDDAVDFNDERSVKLWQVKRG